jgi:hypothetical protein
MPLPRCIALHYHVMLWSRVNIVTSYGGKNGCVLETLAKGWVCRDSHVRNRCAWSSHGHFPFSIWAVAGAPVYIHEASTCMAEAKQEKYELPCYVPRKKNACFLLNLYYMELNCSRYNNLLSWDLWQWQVTPVRTIVLVRPIHHLRLLRSRRNEICVLEHRRQVALFRKFGISVFEVSKISRK